MNILLINHYAGSTEMGMEFRPYYFAREWVKAGHHVDIIAGDYSHLRRKNPEVERDFQTEEIDGIHYHWIRTGTYEGNGAKRAFTMFRFVGKLWCRAGRIAGELKPDAVIASSTYPLDTYAAQRIARKAGAQLIHEVHDMWPATLIELGGMSKWNPFVVLMQIAENSFCRHSDKVVSLLPCTKDYLTKHGMKPEKFVHISNGIVKDEWEAETEIPQEHSAKFAEIRAEGKFVVGYLGGHALSNGLDNLIRAAEKIEDDKTAFVLVGNGVEKPKLQEMAKNLNLKNVHFLPAVKKDQVSKLVQHFDCIYIGGHKSALDHFGVCPNKLFDYMMSAKPILYALNSANNYVEDYHCGITVNPDDIEALIAGLRRMKELDDRERKEMGMNGRNAVLKYFEYNVLAHKFLNTMKKDVVQ